MSLAFSSFTLSEAGGGSAPEQLDTAFLGLTISELEGTAVDDVVVLYSVSFDLLTSVLKHTLDLLVFHFLGSDDAVVGELVLLLELSFDLRSERYVVGEFEVLFRSEVVLLSVLYR